MEYSRLSGLADERVDRLIDLILPPAQHTHAVAFGFELVLI